ncbi:MAG: hypothetical protein D6790_12360 [Caldilineae bacterium]|nr:MAG: hypothetical protein D6790_12360 [Caldilineae bacterium]
MNVSHNAWTRRAIVYEDRPHPHCPGYLRVRLSLADEAHAGVEKIVLDLWSREGSQTHTVLNGRASGDMNAAVSPGPIQVLTERGDVIGLFSFGGRVSTWQTEDARGYTLQSNAPILRADENPLSFVNQLIAEAGALFALERARHLAEADQFTKRLAQMQPAEMYAATLEALLARFDRWPALRRHNRSFYAGLLREKGFLSQSGLWPTDTRPLDEFTTRNSF